MQITRGFIESLLKEDEGIQLDFKLGQYPFAGADDETKSELLKDLLAFANTTRTRDAFILIGVDEANRNAEGSATVCGIQNHLNEAHLQQFVNNKTKRPMIFMYRTMPIEGKKIGMLQIPIQKRPHFVIRDFGKVLKNTVYYRIGSSTRIAGPDEIYQMGQEDSSPIQNEPELSFGFFNRKSGEQYGPQVSVTCTWIDMPSHKEIPDYPVATRKNSLGHSALMQSIHPRNRNYLRDLANFTQMRAFLQPVSMSISNSSSVTANDVRLIMEVEEETEDYYFTTREELPEQPATSHSAFNFPQAISLPTVSNIDVRHAGRKWRIEVRFRKVQAGDTVRLDDDLYVASRHDGILPVNAKLFADNLGNPREIEVGIEIKSRSQIFSLSDLASAHESHE